MIRKYLSTLFMIIFVSVGCYSENQSNIDWKRVNNLWEKYVKLPSGSLANEICMILSDHRLDDKERTMRDALFENIWDNLDVIEKMILEKDRNSLRLAFKLVNFSDGGFAEDLSDVFSTAIKSHPGLFLDEIELQDIPLKEDVLHLICGFGSDFWDKDINALIKEMNLRINSFKRVKSKKLIKIRDRCVSVLKKCLYELKNE